MSPMDNNSNRDAASDDLLDPKLLARRWWLVGLVVLAGILNLIDRQVISVLKPMIQEDLHWTDADYGKLASLFQFSAAVAYLGVGWIVDRLGVKWATPAGVAAWSLAAMAHGWAFTVGQFAAVRVALGATESMGTPSFVKTIASIFSARLRSVVFGISNGASALGSIITPLILPVVAGGSLALGWAGLGWRGCFVAAGALGFLWVLGWIAATRGLTFPHYAELKPENGAVGGALRGTLGLLSDRRTIGIAGAKVLSDQVYWLLLFWAPDFFHRVFQVAQKDLGPPLAVAYLGSAIGSLGSGWISTRLLSQGRNLDRVRKGVMLVSALMVTVAPLALITHNLWMAAGLLAVMLAGHQGFSVSIFSIIGDIIPKARVGKVTSFGALCGNLAGMAIVFVAGEILQAGMGYGPLLAIAAVSYLLGLLWLHLFVPKLVPAPEDLVA